MSDDPTREQAKDAAAFLRREQDISLRMLAGRLGCSPSKAQTMATPDVRRFLVRLAKSYGWKG